MKVPPNSRFVGFTASPSEDMRVQLPVYHHTKIQERLKLIRRGAFQGTHKAIYRHFRPGDPGGFPRPKPKEANWYARVVVPEGDLRTDQGKGISEHRDFDLYCSCRLLEALYLNDFETSKKG